MYDLISQRYFYQKVRIKSKKRYLLLFKGILILLIIVLFILTLVWFRVQNINLGYKISKAKAKQKSLKEIKKALTLEITTLTSNKVLERNMRRYGIELQEPDQNQIYKLK